MTCLVTKGDNAVGVDQAFHKHAEPDQFKSRLQAGTWLVLTFCLVGAEYAAAGPGGHADIEGEVAALRQFGRGLWRAGVILGGGGVGISFVDAVVIKENLLNLMARGEGGTDKPLGECGRLTTVVDVDGEAGR